MRIGCFGSCDQLSVIKNAGFDCAELDFCELTDMNEVSFREFYKEATDSGLGFDVFSGLIPLTERFHASDFNLDYWLSHTEKGAKRAAKLGCTMIPFGAGKCRSIPEDCDPVAAASKVVAIVRALCEVLSGYQIKLVIEPLGPANSNFLNTLPEVEEFLVQVNHSNCSSMCDLRHMYKSNESFCNLTKYKTIVEHAHIDYPKGVDRYFPAPDDNYDYLPYLQALKESGYDKILTVEATAIKYDFATEAANCYTYLRQLIN